MSDRRTPPQPVAEREAAERQVEVDAFLKQVAVLRPVVKGGATGRLIFALDATASRQPTWDRAMRIQGEMFTAAASVGGLAVQLVFYRGFAECKASPWMTGTDELTRRMTAVSCAGGQTQIHRMLGHALKEARGTKVNAVVFVGDACEESPDPICHRAGELGLLGVPVFVFHEGEDPVAARIFQEIARLSGGAYCPFDLRSARQLADLLRAVAVYAAGGPRALERHSQGAPEAVLRLTHQLRRG